MCLANSKTLERIIMSEKSKTKGVKAQIDENLKRVYQEALEQEVPGKLKELIEQLRKKEAGK